MNTDFLEQADYAWLELGDTSNIHTDDILNACSTKDELDAAYHLVKLISQPAYFHLFAKELMGVTMAPHQCVVMQELWKTKYPMFVAARGFSKSWCLAMLIMLKLLLIPNTKVVLTGAGFRQAKIVFEYCETLWNNAPIYRDICNQTKKGPTKASDRWVFHVNDSILTALPLGDGSKIRGARANVIIADEFRSISPEIYETVVQGFGSVEQDPIAKMKEAGRRRLLIDHGVWSEEQQTMYDKARGNQSIIAGTASYSFEHFYDYWKKWHSFITGDVKDAETMFGERSDLSPSDFSIIRIPYDLIPEGFMDTKTIAKAKATVHSSIFLMEYEGCFPKDSDGFYKRSLIESCIANSKNAIIKNDKMVIYDPLKVGDPKKKYVMGIDPASEKDNLAIIIIELNADHNRIVHCWTTNAKDHSNRLKAGQNISENYYAYCCRKIRDLMKEFAIAQILVDGQGGGKGIIEGLHDKKHIEQGEFPIWPVIDRDKPADTDTKEGLHILVKCEFANQEWVSEANNGMRQDMEKRYLLFPRYDALSLSLAAEQDLAEFEDNKDKSKFDSHEDLIMEIEELKDEISTIIMQRTPTGREQYITPELKMPNGKKGRMRKDRYSALVMANWGARTISRSEPAVQYGLVGGLSTDLAQAKKNKGEMYTGNQTYKPPQGAFIAVRRR